MALALLQTSNEDVEPIVDSYLLGTPTPEYRMAYVRYLVGAQRLPAAYAQTVRLNNQAPGFADAWLLRGSLEAQNKQDAAAEAALQGGVGVAPGDDVDALVGTFGEQISRMLEHPRALLARQHPGQDRRTNARLFAWLKAPIALSVFPCPALGHSSILVGVLRVALG